ncbi:MAG: hypothetical protein AB1750_08160 [Chloroflexota bacterium]
MLVRDWLRQRSNADVNLHARPAHKAQAHSDSHGYRSGTRFAGRALDKFSHPTCARHTPIHF